MSGHFAPPKYSMHSNNLCSLQAPRPGPGSFQDGLRRWTFRPILFFPKEFRPREREFSLHCIAFAPSPAAVHSFLTGFQCLVMHVAPLCCGWCVEKKTERFFNAFFWENPGRAELVLLTSIRSLRPPWFTIRNPSIHHLHFYQGTTGNSFGQWFTQVANLLKCFAKNCSLVILQSLARNLTRNMLHVSRDVLMEADIPAGCRLWESSSTKYMCVALSIKEIQLQSGQSSNVD